MDFGETIMNPFTLHQSAIIRETYAELGKESEAAERVRRWYALRDSFGAPDDPPHQRVRLVKQYAKERVYSEVLGDDREAIRLFEQKEALGFTPTEGLSQLLMELTGAGWAIAVVSESASVPAVAAINRFLSAHGLAQYFGEIITPAGLFDPAGTLTDTRFVGMSKKDQTIYDALRAYLEERGIGTGESVMVGDDPQLDVEYASSRGFLTIQYVGVIDRGRSPKADYVIGSWNRFPRSL